MANEIRIITQGSEDSMGEGLRSLGFVVDEAGPVDAVVLHASSGGLPDVPDLAMLRLEHPDALILLSSPVPPPRRLIEWTRAGLDDWVDAKAGLPAIADAVKASLEKREVARQQRQVVNALVDGRRRAASAERELSNRMMEFAEELESAHRELGDAHSTLQNRVAQLVLLYRIGRNLSSNRNWDEDLGELLGQINRFLGAEGVAILLRSDGGQRLAARSVHGLDAERVAEVVEAVRPLSFRDGLAQVMLPLEDLRTGGLTTCSDSREPFGTTIIPLVHRDRELGCLVIEKAYSDGTAFAEDYYFLVTIRTVVAEEVAGAQAFHELRRLQQFHERTLDQVGSGILTVREDGSVGFANRTALELLGAQGPAGVDLDLQLRLGAESPPVRRWLGGLVGSASASIDGWIHRGADEEPIPVSIRATALPGDVPGEDQHVCVLEDDRQRQALDSERRRAARQKDLLIMAAEWAHDVRTPLTGILHSAELMSSALPEGSPRLRHFEVIRSEVERINGLVNHFLDYARPARLREQPSDVSAIAAEAVSLMAGVARQRGNRLRLEGESVVARALVDADQFKQVLLNLLTNALDVTPESGEVEVRVFVAPRAEIAPSGRVLDGVVIEVQDPGPGVSAKDIDRLFVPFFTTKPDGTGLGLAISDKIVRAHGGTLRYERADNSTIFRIVLPGLEERPGQDGQPRSRRRGLKARG